MKIYVDRDVSIWINGKELKVAAGIQEVDDEVVRILIESKNAKAVEKEAGNAQKTKEAKR